MVTLLMENGLVYLPLIEELLSRLFSVDISYFLRNIVVNCTENRLNCTAYMYSTYYRKLYEHSGFFLMDFGG